MKHPQFFSKNICFNTLARLMAATLFMGAALCGANATAAEPTAAPKTIISHGISIHDQLKYPPNFTHFDYTSPKALKGGSLKLHALGTFDSLNPFSDKGIAADKIGLMYETLMVNSYDEPNSQYGLIAEKIEYPEDRSWVIYHINPKARFHDGKPIQASDVVFSFNTLIKTSVFNIYYADIKDVQALDKHTVKFNFKNATNKELAIISGQLPILPEHYWKGKEFNRSSLDVPLGSGPYKVKTVEAGRRIVYERVADHWAKDLPINVGTNNFDQIIIDYYRDDTVATEAFKAGQLDFRYERIAKSWFTSYDIPAAKNGLLKKQLIRDYSPRGMTAFLMNLRRAPFDNIKVREALNYAFDFEWTNRNIFYDSYVRINSYYFNSDLASIGLPTGRELELLSPYKKQLPETVFTAEFKNPVTDGTGNNRANLRRAQQLLTEAGFILVDGKLVDGKTKKPFVIEYLSHDPTFERILNPYAQNLKRLGIEFNIRIVDTSQFVNRLNARDFDVTSLALLQSHSPGNEQREYWSTKAADMPNSRNYMGLKNPVVDELVESLVNAPDHAELVARTRALDRVLLQNHYVIPLWSFVNHRLVYWDKFDQPATAPAFDLTFDVGLMTWWVNPEKAKRLDPAKQ